ncbi:hypothetical protein KCU81_g4306, partial [Aureobasidium melanogenum]|uniref:Uncharacterized protein n=1 Tax=Aureobasidium melanogenum (strain CBS 110374) TaxID=1043003 RepID=A0A074WJU3_AURM1
MSVATLALRHGIPHKHASQDHAAKLFTWKNVTNAALGPASLSKAMKDVYELMRLSDSAEDGDDKSTVAEDVLKVEVAGPEQEHFSVVDVPGTFTIATEGIYHSRTRLSTSTQISSTTV